MAITVQGLTGVFQPSYPDIIDKYGVVTNVFTSSFKEYFTSSGATSYSVNKSLRFRSSASAYVSRTPAVSGNTNTWTWSGWVKRGTSGFQAIYNTSLTGNSNATYGFIGFTGGDDLLFYQYNLGTTYTYLATTQLFRDYAAWYHIAIAYDDAQATASNRVKIYVNGSQITSFSTATYPTASFGGYFNRAQPTYFAKDAELLAGAYFDGEMAEVNFVDGQALAPTLFGASSIYNQWLPIRYAGTYGTNGFYLPFTNTTSTSTLVADSSGNANNWTPNNISLTAGSTYDSLTDVPTLTSTTVANYAVLNPLDKGTGLTLSNANLTYATSGGVTAYMVRATMQIPATGKYYWEATVVSGTPLLAGIATANANVSIYLGQDVYGWGYYTSDGKVYNNNATLATYSTATTGDVIGFAFNSDDQTFAIYKNNTIMGTLTGFTLSGTYFPAAGSLTSGGNFNFGQQPFVYTAPSGFLPLNTFNI
jgi:hypothetical protein